MAKKTVRKASQAIGAVMDIMRSSKMNSWQSRMSLYESIVLSSMSFGISIWGLRYADVIERIQLGFFKRLLCLPNNTPNYMVRLETASTKLSYLMLKSALTWLNTLKSMDSTRLAKLCYSRLVSLSNSDIRFNWLLQVKEFFIYAGCENRWQNFLDYSSKSQSILILDKYKQKLLEDDNTQLINSSYPLIYRHLTNFRIESSYLSSPAPICFTRIIAQIRMCSSKYLRLSFGGSTYKIDMSEICSICNMLVNESLQHILFDCPLYEGLRQSSVFSQIDTMDDVILLFNSGNIQSHKSLTNYMMNTLKLRAFIINE